MLPFIISPDKFLTMTVSGSPPADKTAFALSYSQFVPGKTGIMTFGLAVLIAGAREERPLYSKFLTGEASLFILQE